MSHVQVPTDPARSHHIIAICITVLQLCSLTNVSLWIPGVLAQWWHHPWRKRIRQHVAASKPTLMYRLHWKIAWFIYVYKTSWKSSMMSWIKTEWTENKQTNKNSSNNNDNNTRPCLLWIIKAYWTGLSRFIIIVFIILCSYGILIFVISFYIFNHKHIIGLLVLSQSQNLYRSLHTLN